MAGRLRIDPGNFEILFRRLPILKHLKIGLFTFPKNLANMMQCRAGETAAKSRRTSQNVS